MLVGVSNAAVVFLFEFVFGAAGIRIAALPEILDKCLALIVGGKFLKSGALLVGDDVRDFFAQPLLIGVSISFRIAFCRRFSSLLTLGLGLSWFLCPDHPAGESARMEIADR